MKPLVFSLAIIQFLISTVQAKNPKSCEELNCSYCCSEINGYPECVNDILKCRYSENDNKEEIFILLYSTGAVLIGISIRLTQPRAPRTDENAVLPYIQEGNQGKKYPPIHFF